MFNEHVGEWHTVTVTMLPAEDDLVEELDFAIVHPDTCPQERDDVDPYSCDMAHELDYHGFGNFEITEPGTYRARYHCWESTSLDSIGPEYDSEVEIERVNNVQ